jgi:hypothetical protein
MKKNRLEIKKIPLEGFIDMLMDIYNNGVDYINMVVEKGDRQDNIWIMDEEAPKEEKKLELKEQNIDFEDLL